MASIVNTKGVDISDWQGDIDLSAVKAAGYSWVMIRCGQGTWLIDKRWEDNVRKAEALGMPWGVYHLTEATTSAEVAAEVAFVDKLIKAQLAKGYRPLLPIAIDIERAGYDSDDYTADNLTAAASGWIKGMKKLGYYPMIYTGYYELRDYIRSDVVSSSDIWLAQYNSYPDYTDSNLGLWQYGGSINYIDTPYIDGVDGAVDKDKAYKDYPSIIKAGGFNGWGTPEPYSENEEVYSEDESSVASVQSWLNNNYSADLDVDDIYGPRTKAALVKALQTELNRQYGAGLMVDGIYGNMTDSAAVCLFVGAQGNITKILQGFLICNGYSTNGFDGIFGSGTMNAVKSFQRDNDTTADGIVGPVTWILLAG